EGAHLVLGRARRRHPHTCHHGLLVHVEPRALGMDALHRRVLPFCRRDVPGGANLPSVLRDRGGPWRQSRVRTGRRVHTCYRAARTTSYSTSVPAPAPYQFPASRVDLWSVITCYGAGENSATVRVRGVR